QDASCLDEWAAIMCLVGHAHTLVLGILVLQPAVDLFRRPVQNQFTRNDRLQLPVDGQKARLGPQGRLPGLVIRFIGSILRTAPCRETSGSLSTQLAADLWLSHESTNRKRSLARCPPAPPV